MIAAIFDFGAIQFQIVALAANMNHQEEIAVE